MRELLLIKDFSAVFQICKQIHLLVCQLCALHALPEPDELREIDRYLAVKVGLVSALCLVK